MSRILVIDDNAINLELLSYLLRAWQHEVLVAHAGNEGLDLARRHRPDLIVCDVQMPGRDGYEVARTLRADPALRDIPLVAVTANAMVGDREKALDAGFDAHFAKPIDPQLFMAGLGPLLADHGLTPARQHGGEPQARAGVIRPALRAPRTPCTLLTVDDGPMNVEYKRSLLEPAGYRVLGAGGVSSALALLREQAVDLVLSDVNMADGGGFELIKCLRSSAAWRHLPFIFLTSSARDSASREQGLKLGANNYLVRPLDADLLLAAVRDGLTAGR